jgi:hypothetical protein
MSKIIKLNNASKVFPAKYTKVRAHDLISKSVMHKKVLSSKEQIKLQAFADEVRSGLFKENKDMLAIRNGRRIKFIPF